jgi:SAM-dependent methyltransferase
MAEDVRTSGFWEGRYREGNTRWDLGAPTPSFVALLESDAAPPPGTIAVVGCGRGHDVLYFARHGFQATGFDFAPSAIAAGRAAAAAASLDGQARFEQTDIFDLPQRYPEAFDYVLERACFCAIDPQDRPRYVDVVRQILRPGGRLLAEFFVGGPGVEGGPPFPAESQALRHYFEPAFAVERMDTPRLRGSRPGMDQFAILRRL